MTQQINFYSPLLRRQAFTLLSAAGMAYAVGIAAALCALAGAYESYALNAAQIQAHATDEVHKNVTQVYENVVRKSKIQKPDPRLTAEVAALEARAQDRQAVMDALASKELANTSGFSEYMRAIRSMPAPGPSGTTSVMFLVGHCCASAGVTHAAASARLAASVVYFMFSLPFHSRETQIIASLPVRACGPASPIFLARPQYRRVSPPPKAYLPAAGPFPQPSGACLYPP